MAFPIVGHLLQNDGRCLPHLYLSVVTSAVEFLLQGGSPLHASCLYWSGDTGYNLNHSARTWRCLWRHACLAQCIQYPPRFKPKFAVGAHLHLPCIASPLMDDVMHLHMGRPLFQEGRMYAVCVAANRNKTIGSRGWLRVVSIRNRECAARCQHFRNLFKQVHNFIVALDVRERISHAQDERLGRSHMRSKVQEIALHDSYREVRPAMFQFFQEDRGRIHRRHQATGLRQGHGVHAKASSEIERRHSWQDRHA